MGGVRVVVGRREGGRRGEGKGREDKGRKKDETGRIRKVGREGLGGDGMGKGWRKGDGVREGEGRGG